jgi:hypothetical protein
MADGAAPARTETAVTSVLRPKDLAMTSSSRPTSASPSPRSRRRLAAAALLTLTLIGAAAPAAYAEPDTNIQKPGHIAVQ